MVMKREKVIKFNKEDLIEERKGLIDSFPNVWCISDTHFYHKKIGEYCNRPENWFDLIINNWNSVVSKHDIVFHLGDFAFGSFKKAKNVVEKINGEIYLIRGNHDRHSKTWYKKLNINAISPFDITINDKRYYFSHKPDKHLPENMINIHGHWHENCPFMYTTENGNINFNLSVEVINYKPIKLNSIIKMLEYELLL